MTVWGSASPDREPPPRPTPTTLEQIGLDAGRVWSPDGGVYYATIGTISAREAQTGFDTWFEDFPHPLDFFFLVDGDSIQPTNNPNPGNVDDPLIDSEIDRLRAVDDLDSVPPTGPAGPLPGLAAAELRRPFGPQAGRHLLRERMDPEQRDLPSRSTATTTRAGG